MSDQSCSWYVRGADNQPAGPFTPEELIKRLREGKLDTKTVCWRAGMSQWLSLRRVEPFASTIGAVNVCRQTPSDGRPTELQLDPEAPLPVSGPRTFSRPAKWGVIVGGIAALCAVLAEGVFWMVRTGIVVSRPDQSGDVQAGGAEGTGPARIQVIGLNGQPHTTFLVGLQDAWFTNYHHALDDGKRTFCVVYSYKNLGPREGPFSLGGSLQDGFPGAQAKVEIKTDKGHFYPGYDLTTFPPFERTIGMGPSRPRRSIGGWWPKDATKIGETGESAVVFRIPGDEVPTELMTAGYANVHLKLPPLPLRQVAYAEDFGFMSAKTEGTGRLAGATPEMLLPEHRNTAGIDSSRSSRRRQRRDGFPPTGGQSLVPRPNRPLSSGSERNEFHTVLDASNRELPRRTFTRSRATPRGEERQLNRQSRQRSELMTLKGHSRGVTSVAFSPDGKSIVSGSWDNTLTVWDAESGRPMQTLKANTASISCVAYSHDGKRIVAGGRGAAGKTQILEVWDAASGRQTLTLKGHTGVTSAAFSPDGKRIVSAGWDQALRVWDAAGGKELLTLKGHRGPVESVAFSPDGNQIVSGSRDKTLKIWEAATGREVLTLKGHGNWVLSVAISPDGTRIVSGGSDRTLRVWDAARGRATLMLTGHANAVNAAAFSPDGKWIASGSEDGTIKLWDASTGKQALTLTGHTGDVRRVAFSPDGKRIASGSDDATIRIWDAAVTDPFATQNMQVEILRPGRGNQEAKRDDFLTVNYKTTLSDGRQIDSTYDPSRRPLTFRLGSDPVLEGWHLGLVGMKFREIRRLTIPPEVGFGSPGSSRADIPPNATLISEIELMAIDEGTSHRVKTRP